MLRLDPYTADPTLREVYASENPPLFSSPASQEIELDRDPFFSLPLRRDKKSDGPGPSLESVHYAWERERAAIWADFRNRNIAVAA